MSTIPENGPESLRAGSHPPYSAVRWEEEGEVGDGLHSPETPSIPSDPSDQSGVERRDRRDRRASEGVGGGELLLVLLAHLIGYVAFQPGVALVVSLWVMATHVFDVFDKFPLLAVTSPEKRCGKTTLLTLLLWLCREALLASNVSPASVYRLIELKRPTFLIDEAQSLTRRGSEATEVLRELLCAGIDKNAKVLRVGGANNDEVKEFGIACPKVLASIGKPDGVVLDRCLEAEMRRKTAADSVRPYRSRVAEPEGEAIRTQLEAWATANQGRVQQVYDALEPFDLENDRLAEMLLPLMAVATVVAPDRLPELEEYAESIQAKEREAERQSPGVMLLAACRDIFAPPKGKPYSPGRFISTSDLILRLVVREEEPWATFTRGGTITPEAMATLLRPYGIQSTRNKTQTARGYTGRAFEEAWARYLPTPPGNPVSPVSPVSNG